MPPSGTGITANFSSIRVLEPASGHPDAIPFKGDASDRSSHAETGRSHCGSVARSLAHRCRAGRSGDSRQSAYLLGREASGNEVREEARRNRYRSDHSCGRLRLREPGYARRAVESRIVPLPHAGLSRARASRRDVCHRRRSLCDRLVPRNEPRGSERRCRGSGSRDGDRVRQQHGRHLPPQRAQPRAARGAEPRGGRGCEGWRRVRVRSVIAPLDQSHTGQDLRSVAADGEGK